MTRLIRRSQQYDGVIYYNAASVMHYILENLILRGDRFEVVRPDIPTDTEEPPDSRSDRGLEQNVSMLRPATEHQRLLNLPSVQGMYSPSILGHPNYGRMRRVQFGSLTGAIIDEIILTVYLPAMHDSVARLLAPREMRASQATFRQIWEQYAVEWPSRLRLWAGLKIAWAHVKKYDALLKGSPLYVHLSAMYDKEIQFLETVKVPDLFLKPGVMTLSSPDSLLGRGLEEVLVLPDLDALIGEPFGATPPVVWNTTTNVILPSQSPAIQQLTALSARRPLHRVIEQYAVRVIQALSSIMPTKVLRTFHDNVLEVGSEIAEIKWAAEVPQWNGYGRPIACSAVTSEISDFVAHAANVAVGRAFPANEPMLYPESRGDDDFLEEAPGGAPTFEVLHRDRPITRRLALQSTIPLVIPSRWSLAIDAQLRDRVTALPYSILGHREGPGVHPVRLTAAVEATITNLAAGTNFYDESVDLADRADRELPHTLYADELTAELVSGGYAVREIAHEPPQIQLLTVDRTHEQPQVTTLAYNSSFGWELPREAVAQSRIAFGAESYAWTPVKTTGKAEE